MAEAQSDVAGRYASALFDLAIEADCLAAVEGELVAFDGLLEESDDLRRLAESPVFDADTKLAGFSAILEKAGVGPLVKNFVGVLARNHRLGEVRDVITAFQQLAADHRGEVAAEAISARPLTDDQTSSLRNQIEASLGKAVNLSTTVDPSLLGGLIVKVGSRMVDSSLRTKLNRLQQTLKEA